MPLRVLIVDDSIVARTMLARMIRGRAAFAVVGMVAGAEQALALLATTRVDLIVLDVEMPGIDGLTALPALIAAGRGARVLVVSSQAAHGAAATIRALTLGAADTLLKPTAAGLGDRFAERLAESLLAIAPAAPAAGMIAPVTRRASRAAPAQPVECLAIGASTGGPHALSAFLAALDPGFDAPILVTQHLPAAFMPFFAAQLRDYARRPVRVAADGMRLERGSVLVAPGDAHLRPVRHGGTVRAVLDRSIAPSGCCPSVDIMLGAVAEIYGAAGAGVILTGMGRDGQEGAALLHAAGGEVLAQDMASSVVWGMPGAVADLAGIVAAPAALAARIMARGAA